jgi:hypothetical protein
MRAGVALAGRQRQETKQLPRGRENMGRLSKKDAGVILALVERFEWQRLPTLLTLKDKVHDGQTLSDWDVEFLDRVIDDATRTMPLTEGNPELHEFCARVIHLYKEITEKALENEESKP